MKKVRIFAISGGGMYVVDYALMGRRLQKKRTQAGLTQEQVARMLRVTPAYISRIERGTTRLSLKMLTRLCEVIDVNPGYILTGSVPHKPEYLREEWADLMESMPAGKRALSVAILRLIHQFGEKG